MKNKCILIAAACCVFPAFFSACGNHNPSGTYHSDSTKTEKIRADVQEEMKTGKTNTPDSSAKNGAASKDTAVRNSANVKAARRTWRLLTSLSADYFWSNPVKRY